MNEILQVGFFPPQNYIANNFMWVQIFTVSSFMGVMNYIVNSFTYLILGPLTKGQSESHYYISR